MYTKAIELTPKDVKLYSNRCSAYYKVYKYGSSLADAEKCTELDKDWWKGWFRKGQAEEGLGKQTDASLSYMRAS